jgi:hypothetical protein
MDWNRDIAPWREAVRIIEVAGALTAVMLLLLV